MTTPAIGVDARPTAITPTPLIPAAPSTTPAVVTSSVGSAVSAGRCEPVRREPVRRATTARDWHEATALLHDFAVWIEAASGIALATTQGGFAAELVDLASAYSTPDSSFWLADDGVVGCGTVAVRRHGDGSAELKRMYVRPGARGGGHADRLVEAVVTHARIWGADRIWLETLPGLMDAAIRLYRRHGFREVPAAVPTLAVDGLLTMSLDLRR